MKKDNSISLVIPCYNEEANIQKGVLDKIGNYVSGRKEYAEVLIIDDGSTDQSRSIIRERYLKTFAKFKLIENEHQGKAFAVITGINNAGGDYVMFSDMDLATPIEEAEKLIGEVKNGYDIIIGSRSSQRRGAPLTRKVLAVGFIFIRNIIIGLKGIKDTQCGFKLFRTEAALDILKHLKVFHNGHHVNGPSVSAGFDLEFLYVASKLKYKIKEVPVTWKHVETRNVNFIRDSIETIEDIFRIRMHDFR